MQGIDYEIVVMLHTLQPYVVAFFIMFVTWVVATVMSNKKWRASIYDYVKHDVQITLINQKRTIADLEDTLEARDREITLLTGKLDRIWEHNSKITSIINS